MKIMYKYSDILREIEVIKVQLELTNNEIESWYFNPMTSANSSLNQVDRLVTSRNELFDRMETLERAKTRTESIMRQFEGLEYKIAYLRIIEHMTHKEIAGELGYEEQTIRKKWSRMMCHELSTDSLISV